MTRIHPDDEDRIVPDNYRVIDGRGEQKTAPMPMCRTAAASFAIRPARIRNHLPRTD